MAQKKDGRTRAQKEVEKRHYEMEEIMRKGKHGMDRKKGGGKKKRGC